MKRGTVNKTVLLVIVFIISTVFVVMINQFLMPLFMAGLFSAMVSPAHNWLSRKLGGRENIASILTIFGIVFLVLGPLSILIGVVVAQAIHVGQSITPWVQDFISRPSEMTRYLEKIPYYEQILPFRDVILQKVGEFVGSISSFLIDSLSSVTKMTMQAVFSSVIMLYVMFYFLTMGDKLLMKILYFLPLHDRDEQLLLRRFTSVARATIKGTIIIGIMQGAICGAVAGNLDNFIRPRLVGKDTEMHDLFVLFGTLGGIAMFGLLGIIIGPIVAALFITVWEIYGDAFRDHLPDVGVVLRAVREEAPISAVDEGILVVEEDPEKRENPPGI